jgi:hypothetical protein
VFVVALSSLVTPIEVESAALASDLGLTPYETRMMLTAGLPAIILTTPDRERALGLLAKVRGRGHGAIACDGDAVVGSSDMTSLHYFRFEPDALVTDVPPRNEERLPYDDILVGIRALHRRSNETTTEVKEKKFDATRAIASGGLIMRKSSTREIKTSSEDREQVFYLFRKSGQKPWILAEGGAKYNGLGADISHTLFHNFLKTIERLKSLAPTARFDDRLLTAKKMPERISRPGGSGTRETSSADGVDLMAHLLALAIARDMIAL